LENAAKIAPLSLALPKSGLQRCRAALISLGLVFSNDTCCLAWTFFVSLTHPVCVS
jgi:hypothetical protein